MSLTMEERVARYETMRREGRLLRKAWFEVDDEGRERACRLAALSPEVVAARTSAACPADVMPQWLAILTTSLDDRVSDKAWPVLAERFGRCAARWHVLDEDAWASVERAVKLEALSIARAEVTEDPWGVLPAIDEAMRLLHEGGMEAEEAGARAAALVVRTREDGDLRGYSSRAAHAATYVVYTALVRSDGSGDAVYAADGVVYTAVAVRRVGRSNVDAFADMTTTWDRIAVVLFDTIDRAIALHGRVS